MKEDTLYQMLLNLFEHSLGQELEQCLIQDGQEAQPQSTQVRYVKPARKSSMRILSQSENDKLSIEGQHYLFHMHHQGVLNQEDFEQVLHLIGLSESKIVSLDETKWLIREHFSERLSDEQMAYLDLILYPENNQISLQ